jgi:hypothetical protein
MPNALRSNNSRLAPRWIGAPISKGDSTARVSHTAPLGSWWLSAATGPEAIRSVPVANAIAAVSSPTRKQSAAVT